MKIATFNVNSVRVRLPSLCGWLARAVPDILLLQELKCSDDAFPLGDIRTAGYHAVTRGQRGYNGVAVLSRQPVRTILDALPGDGADDQARYLEVETACGLRIASLYCPNGNPVDSGKFSYKLAWMERLAARVRALHALEGGFVLGGDYNVCPGDIDVWSPEAFRGDALCDLRVRRQFRSLCHTGVLDAFRLVHPDRRAYSYWDYQGGAFGRDEGLRIDHLLVSPRVADRLVGAGIDQEPRHDQRPSDHTPVWCLLEPAGTPAAGTTPAGTACGQTPPESDGGHSGMS